MYIESRDEETDTVGPASVSLSWYLHLCTVNSEDALIHYECKDVVARIKHATLSLSKRLTCRMLCTNVRLDIHSFLKFLPHANIKIKKNRHLAL